MPPSGSWEAGRPGLCEQVGGAHGVCRQPRQRLPSHPARCLVSARVGPVLKRPPHPHVKATCTIQLLRLRVTLGEAPPPAARPGIGSACARVIPSSWGLGEGQGEVWNEDGGAPGWSLKPLGFCFFFIFEV